jgi:hypothetical protein
MRWRTLRIAVLVFQAIWLNVVVPGHKRGAVADAGWSCAACDALPAPQADSSCPRCDSNGPPTHGNQPPAHDDPAQHCAICHFAAHLSLPPAIDLSLSPHFLVETAQAFTAASAPAFTFASTYDGRAPPA